MANEDFEMLSANSHQSNEGGGDALLEGTSGYQTNRKVNKHMLNLDDL